MAPFSDDFVLVADNIFDLLASDDTDDNTATTLEEVSEPSLNRASRIVSDMRTRKFEIEKKVEELKNHVSSFLTTNL